MRLGKAIADLVQVPRQWERAVSLPNSVPRPVFSPRPAIFREVKQFGSNPGNLRMVSYRPKRLRRGAPLVVVLHGCHQSAANYAICSGWMSLANEYDVALLLPEQRRANNRNSCFTWYHACDASRDQGETLSVRQMIDWCLNEHQVDPAQIFVTGLSAGAAIASTLLAAYPDVFRGGALVAGLPVGSAVNIRQALSAMARPKSRSNDEWGDLVRAASPHRDRWPVISVWHGTADPIVSPANAEASVRQWCNVHDLDDQEFEETDSGEIVRRRWRDRSGRVAVEQVKLIGFGHGAPIDVFGRHGPVCGTPGPFVLDAGVSSAREIAKFFGISQDRAIFSFEGLKRCLLG